MKNILIIGLQIIVGLCFITSALLKIWPIEPIELFVYSFGALSWSKATIAVRLLIGTEILIGSLLILNIYRKQLLQTCFAVLIAFSLFLIYNILTATSENCYCFGEVLPMSNEQSLVKNFLLILAVMFLYYKEQPFRLKHQKYIGIGLILSSLSTPFIANVPDVWVQDKNALTYNHTEFQVQHLPDSLAEKVMTGNKALCFFSLKCKYCKMAAKKITTIHKRQGEKFDVYYFFLGQESDLDQFWKDSESEKFPNQILPGRQFFRITEPALPRVFLVKDGKVKAKLKYRTITESAFTEAFE